jgi:Fe-S cluster biogenesis protein NfuA
MTPCANGPDLKGRIERVLAEEVAPALQLDGSAVEVLDINAGVVRVRLTGACTGCASAIMTIIMGMEQELRRRFPEIEYLEAVP